MQLVNISTLFVTENICGCTQSNRWKTMSWGLRERTTGHPRASLIIIFPDHLAIHAFAVI